MLYLSMIPRRSPQCVQVYRAKGDGKVTHQQMRCRIGRGALVVFSPDAVIPFTEARFQQDQRFELEPGASVAVVDQCGSGRVASGERWAFSRYTSRSKYYTDCEAPTETGPAGRGDFGAMAADEAAPPGGELVLTEAVSLLPQGQGRVNWGLDLGGTQRNSFASLVLLGPRTAEARARLTSTAAALASASGTHVAGSSFRGDERGAICVHLPPL